MTYLPPPFVKRLRCPTGLTESLLSHRDERRGRRAAEGEGGRRRPQRAPQPVIRLARGRGRMSSLGGGKSNKWRQLSSPPSELDFSTHSDPSGRGRGLLHRWRRCFLYRPTEEQASSSQVGEETCLPLLLARRLAASGGGLAPRAALGRALAHSRRGRRGEGEGGGVGGRNGASARCEVRSARTS